MTRGPRPHRALAEAIPIVKARGIVQLALSGPERVFDIAIISKVPVTFAWVMFAPEILATTRQFADDFKEEIAQLRIIARDAAITAEALAPVNARDVAFLPGNAEHPGRDRSRWQTSRIGTDARLTGRKYSRLFPSRIFLKFFSGEFFREDCTRAGMFPASGPVAAGR